MKEAYEKLTTPQKATLRRKYIALFGRRSSFYDKISGKYPLRPAERIFFSNHLNIPAE